MMQGLSGTGRGLPLTGAILLLAGCASGGSSGGAYTALDHKDLGSNGAGTANMAGFIQRLAVLEAPWSDAEAKLRTAVT